MLDQAVQAYRNTLEVSTEAVQPQGWATTQYNLGGALKDEGEHSKGEQAAALLGQAVQAFRNALQIFTPAVDLETWFNIEGYLGDALIEQAEFANPDQSDALFDQAVQLEQDAANTLKHSDSLQPWSMMQMALVNAELAAARFNQCLEQAAPLAEVHLSPDGTAILDTLTLACQWGAGNKAAALEAERDMLPDAAKLQSGGWNFIGSTWRLSHSPAFATGRASWISLFISVQLGDGDGAVKALHQLEPILQ